jgi:heme/copper-type cytochrome/quinol oxidase subunit 2
MDNVEVTWVRALSIWWSFCWRAMVLSFLIVVPLEGMGMFFLVSHIPHPGQPLDPQQSMRVASTMLILWPLMMALVVAIQVVAMRWMLRSARWADFRLAVLPPDQR